MTVAAATVMSITLMMSRVSYVCNNPQEGSVVFDDQIRGPIEFSNQELDDLIIRRTDGSPTYNFCVVVDDWDMEITRYPWRRPYQQHATPDQHS